MKIDIDTQVASELTAAILMEDYKHYCKNSYCFEGSQEDYDTLLDAYKLLISYYTLPEQRKDAGIYWF